MVNFDIARIRLLDGGKFSLSNGRFKESHVDELWTSIGSDIFDENVDEDIGTIDMTRCEQLLAGKHQLYGCAICTLWVLRAASTNPTLDMNELLDELDQAFDGLNGFEGVIRSISPNCNIAESLLQAIGYACRPRRYEILMALSRMRGIEFEELPLEDRIVAEMKQKEREEEEKRRLLAELWANRRKK